ncbi:stalk domain-containing protein [Paenibacillus sp. V4I7]
MDGPSLLLAGRTYVPLRFISESLGLQVDWHAPTQIIQISN